MSRIPGTEIVVRTYNDDMSETESVVSDSVSDPDSELDEGQDKTLDQRMEENKDFVQDCIDNRNWILIDMEARRQIDDETIVQWPTASNLIHKTLHPCLYRCVGDVGSLNDLARLLQAPVRWEDRYNAAMLNGAIRDSFTRFRTRPPSTAEAEIENAFHSVVLLLSASIGALVAAIPQKKVIVGGILAQDHLNVRAQTDNYFLRVADGHIAFSTESKNTNAFPRGHPCYRKSRMTQVVTALYGHGAPTLLYTNEQFKLFVENKKRNGILTFPFGNSDTDPFMNSLEMNMMDDTLLKIVVICLLSNRPSRDAKPENISAVTPKKVPIPRSIIGSMKKAPQGSLRRSARLTSRSVQSGSSFFTGLDDHGNPMYRAIRVMPEELVQQFEGEIEAQEKAERLSKLPAPLVAMDSNETLQNL